MLTQEKTLEKFGLELTCKLEVEMLLILSFLFCVNFWYEPVTCRFCIHYPCYISQPGKSLYTTVRELVENALDSAEAIAELPIIEITMYVSVCVCIS